MNIYEVPLTIKVNPMWYFISGMLICGKIFTRFFLNSINNEIKRFFNLNTCLNSRKKNYKQRKQPSIYFIYIKA